MVPSELCGAGERVGASEVSARVHGESAALRAAHDVVHIHPVRRGAWAC